MKKIGIIIVLLVCAAFNSMAANETESRFKLDETNLDEQFEKAIDVTNNASQLFVNNELSGVNGAPKMDSKHQTAAIVSIIQLVTVIGALVPIHRFILGTNGEDVKIFFAYFCTGSGCGVGLLLDAIFLIMHMDETNYENNGKIIMWRDNT